MSERPFKRELNGGLGRGFFHGNGRGAVRETNWTVSKSEQSDIQEEWSILESVERRDDSPVRWGLHRTSPTPPSSKDRLFTDWSSLESPCARTLAQSVPVRETGQNINKPDNQTTQPGSEPAQIGAMGNALHDDINVSSPRTCRQPDELGMRMIDMGTNTSDIEVRPQRDGSRVMTLEDNVQASCPLVDVILPTGMNEQLPIPHINLSISGYDPESLRGSHIRTQDTGIQENSTILQLDEPVSIPIRDRRQ